MNIQNPPRQGFRSDPSNIASIHAGEQYAFCLFGDADQRLETLLLEIRHLQANIIYLLRQPIFYRLLRYEEDHIWCQTTVPDEHAETEGRAISWLELFDSEHVLPVNLDQIAELWIPDLPGPGPRSRKTDRAAAYAHIAEQFGLRKEEGLLWIDSLVSDVADTLQAVRATGRWTDMFRINYRLLRSLQVLKRNVLIDKLHLTWWANRAFALDEWLSRGGSRKQPLEATTLPSVTQLRYGTPWREGSRETVDSDAASRADRIAEFLIVRAGALRNARRNVEHLGDLHSQFERVLDMGGQDHHRPITSRRREQGFYNDVLYVRSKDLYDELEHVFLTLDGQKQAGGARRKRARQRDANHTARPVVTHRWHHDYASRNFSMVDISGFQERARQSGEDAAGNERLPFAMHMITTSFWMPDRPDLQPVIGHECAHVILRERFGDLQDYDILSRGVVAKSSPLRELMRRLFELFRIYGWVDPHTPTPGFREWRVSHIREVVVDLMATSAVGPAYVHALCAELIGIGLSHLLQSSISPHSDLSRAEAVFESAFGDVTLEVDWYHRLVLVCDWARAAFPKKTGLTSHMIEGVEWTTHCLFEYLARKKTPWDPRWGPYYREFSDALTHYTKSSRAAEAAFRWRDSLWRSGDEYAKGAPADAAPHVRRLGRLSNSVRAALIEWLAWRKDGRKHNGAGAGSQTDAASGREDVIAFFADSYLPSAFGLPSKRKWRRGRTPEGKLLGTKLFCHLYDIPWECVIMRSFDILDDLRRYGPDLPVCPLITLTHDYAPGRELHEVALEFVVGANHTSKTHLQNARRMTAQFMNALEGTPQDLPAQTRSDIEHWQEVAADLLNEGDAGDQAPFYHSLKELRDLLATASAALAGKGRVRGKHMDLEVRAIADYAALGIKKKEEGRVFLERDILSALLGRGRGKGPALSHRVSQIVAAFPSSRDMNGEVVGKSDIGEAFAPERVVFDYEDRISLRGTINKVNAYQVLGRNDFFTFRESRSSGRWRLPVFNSETARVSSSAGGSRPPESSASPHWLILHPRRYDEDFVPHFERRELALRFNIREDAPETAGAAVDLASPGHPADVAAFIAIRLDRRRSRLDFAYRLRRAANTDRKDHSSSPTAVTSHRDGPLAFLDAALFRTGDHAYLLEGWADILLVLTGDIKSRLPDVFAIQTAIFDDYVTARTELFLSGEAVYAAVAEKWKSGNPSTQPEDPASFQVVQMLRCGGDKEVKSLIHKTLQDNNVKFRLLGVPGRSDFQIQYDGKTLRAALESAYESPSWPSEAGATFPFVWFKYIAIEEITTTVGEIVDSTDNDSVEYD